MIQIITITRQKYFSREMMVCKESNGQSKARITRILEYVYVYACVRLHIHLLYICVYSCKYAWIIYIRTYIRT